MLVPEFSYYINLGFWYLKLLVILSVPVIGYVIRLKWRFAVAKEAEIKRLMVLAAEEAARAEKEAASVGYYADVPVNRAAYGYGGEFRVDKGTFGYCPEDAGKAECAEVASSRVKDHQCAVCLSPTTTRCSRCKYIRYCSAKCQIFHWRKGHRDECHPPSIVNQPSDSESYPCLKAFNQGKDETLADSVETEDRHLKQYCTRLEGETFCGVGQMEKLHGKNDNIKAENLQEVKPSNSTASFSTSFSSDSSSSVNGDSSDDASTTASSGSSDLQRSNGRHHAGASNQAKYIADRSSETKQRDVRSGTTTPSKLNGTRPISNQHDNQRASYITPSSNIEVSNSLVTKSDASDFWEGALDYRWSESVNTKSHATNDDLSNLGSSLRQEASLYGKIEKSNHVDGNIHCSNESAFLKKKGLLSSEVESPIQSSSKMSKRAKDVDSSVLNVSVHNAVKYSPSNSNGTRSSVDSGEKVACSVAKVDVVKSNDNVATSNKSSSLKVVNGLKTSSWKAVDYFKASKLSRGCGADERHENKGMFSFELFKSLYGWNKVELQPCGLVNCGNSCYANAVLQCLSFTPPLTAYLLQRLHSKSCTKRDWCFTCELEKLILKAKDGNSPISPIGIISQLRNIGSHLSNGREEDAHEFLRYVVDTMQSICIKKAINKVAGTMKEETTLLGLTFGGYLQSKIRCMKCGNKSERSERIMDLTVEIEGSIGSLEGALERFTSSETLDAENKYNCSRCKSYQKAKKKLIVLEAPNILTIALKRFQAGKFGKLNKWIDFPEFLDMAPYMSRKSDDKAPVYKLYGVIVHLDTMNAAFSGHYVCYVKNIQNKWFKIDDSVVKTVEFRKVKEQAAYMLLYARCLPKAPKYLKDKSICDSKSTLPLTTGYSPITSGPYSPNFDHITSSEAYCNRHHLKFETDSYSDNNSLFSSCSDEYSCSTDSSSKESNSADDLSDLIFGDSGRGVRCPCKRSSDSDSSSPSTSPLFSANYHSSH